MKWFLPIFGGCGFFGYYGHFLDLRRFERVRLYASEWKNFVEITDIYEERLYVSCSDADCLIAELMPPGGNRLTEEAAEEEEEERRRNGRKRRPQRRRRRPEKRRRHKTASDLRKRRNAGPENGPKRREYAINCIIPKSTIFYSLKKTEKMKKYRCVVCEWIYDPAVGDPDGGIAPGTPFEEIPDDWVCPVCGVGKDQFEEVEE